jgi:hypothetical protein
MDHYPEDEENEREDERRNDVGTYGTLQTRTIKHPLSDKAANL